MSNKQFLLAFSASTPLQTSELLARINSAQAHLAKIASTTLTPKFFHRGRNGIVGWVTDDDKIGWPVIAAEEQRAAGWLHIPPMPSKLNQQNAAANLAFDITHERIERWRVGAPFACVTLSPSGDLRVANDVFGSARLYRFQFDGLTIWASRQGLAHVFAGQSPRMNRTTWHSMATLGWPALGSTLMGDGEQLAGLSLDHVPANGPLRTKRAQADWLSDYSSRAAPLMSSSADSIKDVLRTTDLWPSHPVADLSGGKDSRVIAAAAIMTGVTKTVRTVRTDYGEVETAKQLVEASPIGISHQIQDVNPPHKISGGIGSRLLSQQRVWEGHYLARSMYKADVNPGIKASKRARLNGLGGEAIQGGELMGGAWRARINAGGQAVAFERLERLVTNPRATTSEAKETTVERFLGYAKKVRELEWSHPEAPINFVYNTDRMPHWSLPFADRSTVVPFYAPVMLLHMARASRAPYDSQGIHKQLLSSLIPSWAEIPFYKPTAKNRATAFMWDYEDWNEAKALILERGNLSESFERSSISSIVETIEQGEGTLAEETVLVKLLWEVSFHEYLAEVSEDAQKTAQKVSSLSR